MRKTYFQPNAISTQTRRLHSDGVVRSIGLLTCHGGAMSGKTLAVLLGMSPRGLRRFFRGTPAIQPEIRDGESGRGETWYRLDLAALNCLRLECTQRTG